ncbi:MAG: hypothetical protein ABSE62_04965 [Chthoniobacteraceae bacterium]|jgi:hypothetical protein
MKFPAHKCGLFLSHNEHRDVYQTVTEFIGDGLAYSFRDETSMYQCIATGELWTLHWYPETPIGFHLIAAPTLEELLAFAEQFEETGS